MRTLNAPSPGAQGRAPIHEAVYALRVDVVRELVRHPGFDLGAAAADGATALHVATYWCTGPRRATGQGAPQRAQRLLQVLLEAEKNDRRTHPHRRLLERARVPALPPCFSFFFFLHI